MSAVIYRDFARKLECGDFKFMGIACIPAILVIKKKCRLFIYIYSLLIFFYFLIIFAGISGVHGIPAVTFLAAQALIMYTANFSHIKSAGDPRVAKHTL